ncbi:hypothetical protein [Azospirillum sp. B2RO_4]|uniref:hypothetical protein n=1 Tax=Azospirillum sp. B2RO_4 TaxID=3027796 RepID=UPI003DA94E61
MGTIVNDLMTFLNSRLGLSIPLLPLSGFPRFMVAIWQLLVDGWEPGDGLPTDSPPGGSPEASGQAVVQTDVSGDNPFPIPIGGTAVEAIALWIEIGPPPGSPP